MRRCIVLLAVAAAAACADQTRDRLLVVVWNGKYGYIDHTGRVVIRPQFSWADDFWRGLGEIYACGHYAFIDASGRIAPFRVARPGRLEPHSDGHKVGFVDEHGQFKIPPSFDEALSFSDGLAAVKIGERWGFVDGSGRQVIPAKFTGAYYFHDGVGTADLDSADVLIDKSGRVLATGFGFEQGIASQGRVPVTGDDKSGYLDLLGHIVIPLIYDSVSTFSDGLAAVETAGKWGYIDTSGRVIIPFEFDDAGRFGSGLAAVKLGTRTAFINRSGSFVFDLPFDTPPTFSTLDEESGSLTAGSDVTSFWTPDHKFGYVNTNGRVIWGLVEESPSHPPLLGWTDEMKVESCKGIPESMKAEIARVFAG